MISIGFNTDIGIVLIDSEWISIRYFRQGVEERVQKKKFDKIGLIFYHLNKKYHLL